MEERPGRLRRRVRVLRDCYSICSIGILTSIRAHSRRNLSRDQSPLILRVHKKEQHQNLQRLRRSRTIGIRILHTDSLVNHLTKVIKALRSTQKSSTAPYRSPTAGFIVSPTETYPAGELFPCCLRVATN